MVDVSVQQNCAADRRMASCVVYRVRMKFGSSLNLCSQIRARAKQKPAFGITADGYLRLRSSFPAEGSRS